MIGARDSLAIDPTQHNELLGSIRGRVYYAREILKKLRTCGIRYRVTTPGYKVESYRQDLRNPNAGYMDNPRPEWVSESLCSATYEAWARGLLDYQIRAYGPREEVTAHV